MRGRISGVAPLYVRGDSYGEYVFDHGWAHAYERAGGRYYPKLLCGVPFSPVPGPRLLVRPGEFAEQARAALASAMIEVARRSGLSSVHVNFLPKEEWDYLGELGFLKRLGQQYHWYNDGYRSFDDFLAALNSRKRKTIRKERRTLEEWGLTFEALTGNDLGEEHWDLFHRFYRNTVDRKWGGAYLTRDFFFRLHETMADRTVLIVGRREGKIVCGALNMRGADTLYGRNWGCDTRLSLPAFRGLLLSGHRLCDPRGPPAGRGRGPGPAQDPARLRPRRNLQRALDRRPQFPPGGRRLSGARARRRRRRKSNSSPTSRRSGKRGSPQPSRAR